MTTTAPGAGPRGPYAKTAAKRAAIARAAYEIVQEVGHENLTTAAVAERAGMSERTMLYHFPTRDHLLVAALDHFDNVVQGDGRLEELRRSRGDLRRAQPTHEESEEVIRRLVAGTAADDARLRLYCYLAGEAQTPGTAAHEHFSQHYAEARRGLAAMIASMQRAGLARTDRDADGMGRRFLAAWDGLQQQWVVTRDFDLGDEVLAAFAEITGQDLLRTRTAVAELLEQI